jgi:hypothetical protein
MSKNLTSTLKFVIKVILIVLVLKGTTVVTYDIWNHYNQPKASVQVNFVNPYFELLDPRYKKPNETNV